MRHNHTSYKQRISGWSMKNRDRVIKTYLVGLNHGAPSAMQSLGSMLTREGLAVVVVGAMLVLFAPAAEAGAVPMPVGTGISVHRPVVGTVESQPSPGSSSGGRDNRLQAGAVVDARTEELLATEEVVVGPVVEGARVELLRNDVSGDHPSPGSSSGGSEIRLHAGASVVVLAGTEELLALVDMVDIVVVIGIEELLVKDERSGCQPSPGSSSGGKEMRLQAGALVEEDEADEEDDPLLDAELVIVDD